MRKFVVFSLVVILFCSLAPIGKSEEKTRLRVLDVTGKLDPVVMTNILSGFKSKKSGLSAELKSPSDLKTLYQEETRTNIIYNILADEPIDLIVMDVRDDLLYYLNKGVLVSVKESGIQKNPKEIIPAPALEFGGETWGVPFDIEAYGYFYNISAAQTAGYNPEVKETTFEDCLNFHLKLKKDGKPNSFYIRNDDPLGSSYLLTSQENIFDQLTLPNTVKLATNNLKKFNPLWVNMIKNSMVTSSMEDIKANRVVDGIISTSEFIKIRQAYPEIKWGFTSLPTMNKKDGNVVIRGKCLAVPCSAKAVADVAELVNWLTTEQSQATYSLLDSKDFSKVTKYAFPVNKNLWSHDVYTSNPHFEGITGIFQLAAWAYVDFAQRETDAELAGIYDKILKGADLTVTLTEAEKKINGVFKENRNKYPEFYNKGLFGIF